MKKYTIEDFEKFEKNEYGYIVCPGGDYTEIKEFPNCCSFGEYCGFGKCCSFGERCSFGKCCSFGEYCSFGKCCKIEENKEFVQMLTFGGFGSEKRTTYFFLLADEKIYVRCGCFAGYIDEFRNKVKETHENNKYAQGYLRIADLVQWQFTEE